MHNFRSSVLACRCLATTNCIRPFSSKTPIQSNVVASSVQKSLVAEEGPESYPYPMIPPPHKRIRKRKAILVMDEKEYEGRTILQKQLPLIDRRGEMDSYIRRSFEPEKKSYIDYFSVFHRDWDFRLPTLKRLWSSMEAEVEIKRQLYNPKRNKVLGNDLAAAHFVVFRKGRVRFKGHTEWITEYRKDAKPGVEEDDLPVMRFDLCTLPVNFDPRFRVEALDCGGLEIRYEALLNFENLNYLKWLSFRATPFVDDWCLDRITRIFYETLEYIDLSGCTRVSERGIGALSKCKNLKTLVVEDMPHLRHLEMVAAMLEDQLPELTVFGVDYAKKTEQLRAEGEEIERKLAEATAALEANTINIEPKSVADLGDKR